MANQTSYSTYAFLISLLVIFETTAQFHIKKSQEHDSYFLLLLGYLFYIGVVLSLRKSYEYQGMGLTNFAWSIVSIVSMMVVGHLYFGEEIDKYDIIGISLSIIGLYFIFLYGHQKNQ